MSWIEGILMVYHGTNFSNSLLTFISPQSHKDSKIEDFFRLEQKNMSVSEYEKRFSELVRLVPYIQADEVLKCKRFLVGLQHRIRVHLSVVPQNRFGDLVEAALRVEKSTTTMY